MLDDLRNANSERIAFFEFVQWLADEQLQNCRRRAHDLRLPIGLYLDVAVGVRPDGFDAWSDQNSLLPTLRVGAHRISTTRAGKNWGLAGFHPVGLEVKLFEPFRRMLQASMRHAGAIRHRSRARAQATLLDPDGMRPDQGVYVRFPFEALLAVAPKRACDTGASSSEKTSARCPRIFATPLSDWGIWSYRSCCSSAGPTGAFFRRESYRDNAIATSLPTTLRICRMTRGNDLAVKRRLGIDPGETDYSAGRRSASLRSALSAGGNPPSISAVAGFLARTPVASLGRRHRGCVGGHAIKPICRQRLMNTRTGGADFGRVEDLKSQPGLRTVADAIVAAGRSAR